MDISSKKADEICHPDYTTLKAVQNFPEAAKVLEINGRTG
jgi:hypothetical protein